MTDEIKKITGILEKWVNFAYLFGSRVKGTADQRSDWDIAAWFSQHPDNLPDWTVFQLEAEISAAIGSETQIIPLNNLDAPVLAFEIISSGLLILEKNPDARILYETTVLRRYHDWQYFLNRHMALDKNWSSCKVG